MGKTKAGWRERFLRSTRGRVLVLLRRGVGTVNDLAAAVGLTDNAVRAHLARLERDGLVRGAGTRPGVRKPHATYQATGLAEQFFPKAYGPLLAHLLDVLDERLTPAEVEDALRAVGRRAAAGFGGGSRGDLHARVRHAVRVLEELGGVAEVDTRPGALVIRGHGCPLSAATAGHPPVCRLAEEMLSELIGAPVAEQCATGPAPRCVFRVAVPA